MRRSWTNERLDDFRAETARRFDTLERRVDEGFARIDTRFERVDRKFERIDQRFERIDQRFEALNRTILQLGGGGIVTLVVGFLGVILAQ